MSRLVTLSTDSGVQGSRFDSWNSAAAEEFTPQSAVVTDPLNFSARLTRCDIGELRFVEIGCGRRSALASDTYEVSGRDDPD